MTEYSPHQTGEFLTVFPNFQNCACCKTDLKDNKHHNQNLDIICSSKHTVFLELCFWKTVRFLEHIMSAYPSMIQWRLLFICIPCSTKLIMQRYARFYGAFSFFIVFKFSVLRAFLIKQLLSSCLLDMRWLWPARGYTPCRHLPSQ